MNKIRILPAHEVQKIAAGEVVERPANVVKELAENALDAGATSIELHINNGGKDLIRIIDNGCGMSATDARLSIIPHATSKITSVDDLQTINSFGFRGEALASICAVSTVTLRTKQAHDEVGIQLTISNGTIHDEQLVACPDGTDISITGIFDTVPARKKFLKPTETELRHILQLFQSLVLAHQNVNLKLFCDGDMIHNCPASTELPTRVVQLWNHYLADQLLPIQAHDEVKKVQLTGLACNHQFARYNTSQIFFFVNKRWIKNTGLTKALIRGYQNVLPPGKYPAAMIFLTIDPTLVDINIHPRKEEVQFVHERGIEQLVQQTIKDQLQKQVTIQLHIPPPSVHQSWAPSTPVQEKYTWQPAWYTNTPPLSLPAAAAPFQAAQSPQQLPQIADPDYRLIGRLAHTYLLLEKNNNLVIIDYHAAHERILFERFKQKFTDVPSVPLLFAHIVTLTQEDTRLLSEHHELLSRYGISIEAYAADRIAIRSVPIDLKNADLSGLITEIAALLQHAPQDLDHIHHELCAQMACKAAVKAGDELSDTQMHELIRQLEKTENSLTCPHGRPTMWVINATDLERKFKRLA